ncbi:MAG TPA: UDP-glucose--hexose-1-phosphate uridylyltransferase [Bacteroidota bacterium]
MPGRDLSGHPHRRKNILTGEWVLVSPQRTRRPWQGEVTELPEFKRPAYDPTCYLCPGNRRANGEVNPRYTGTYVFTNDFPALLPGTPKFKEGHNGLLSAVSESGICRVVNFSPRHDLTLAGMKVGEIVEVVRTWQAEYKELSTNPQINYIQIFENRGSMMGNSNPHPHCQIWAQRSIPVEPAKELRQFTSYYSKRKKSLLGDYLRLETKVGERMVFENGSFAVLVPFWAVWPYETIIISKRKFANVLQLSDMEVRDFAEAMSVVTVKYDNLFNVSFPYSAGIHQAPTDGRSHPECHFHMHFLPPLLRSANVKKFMVGYEMLAEPQRDLTPEESAKALKKVRGILS